MDYQTLLHNIEARITPKMREDFQKEFFEDEFNKHLNPQSYKVKYYEILNDYKGFYDDPTDLNFLQELMELKILQDFKLEDAHLNVKEINRSIHDFYRFKQLDFKRPSSNYDSKLKFISEQYSNYFNVFRTYSLPPELFDTEHQSLCNVSVFPTTKVEVDEYISFLEKYLTPSGDYRDFYGSNQRSTEFFIQVCVDQLTPDNCQSIISDYLSRLEQFYPVRKYEDIYAISVDFYRELKKFNLNINEFLYQTSDPFIYFLTLFFRRLSQPVGEFKYYLETFDWEKEKDKVLYLNPNDIEISPKAGYESSNSDPNFNGTYPIYYSNFEQKTTFETIFQDKILKDDFNLIKVFFKELYAEIFNASHNIESFISKKIDQLNIILPSLENNKLRTLLLNSIIPFISKSEINQINPLIWHTFSQRILSFKDQYLKTLPPDMVKPNGMTGITDKQPINSETNSNNKNATSNQNKSPKEYGRDFTDIEKEFINKLNSILITNIHLKIDDYKVKNRLNYSTCASKNEKIKYLKKEIKQYKISLKKCSPFIAEYCHTYLSEIDVFSNYPDKVLDIICKDFISVEFYEPIEDLSIDSPTIEDIQNFDDNFWESFLVYEYEGDDGVIYRKNVKSFIKYVALTDQYLTNKISLNHLQNEFDIENSNTNKIESEGVYGGINTTLDSLINSNSYDFFKSWFHDPLQYSPLGYYHQWQENLKYLKIEIQDNLLKLNPIQSKLYLERLMIELFDLKKTSNSTIEDLNMWYNKYNTTQEDLVQNYDHKNTLHKILNGEPINDRHGFDEDIHPDTIMIQRTFHNYQYGQVIEAALSFISDVKKAVEPIPSINNQLNITNIDILNHHNQTNLTQINNIENNQINIGPQNNSFEGPTVNDSVNSTEFNVVTDSDNDTKEATLSDIKSKTEGFKFKKTLTEIELKTILEDHHDELVKLGLIDRSITNFKSAYIGNKPFTKIIWKKGIPLLQYYAKKFSTLVDNKTKWVMPAQIFLKFDGSEISNNQLAKTKLSDGPIIKDNDIDDLIADFYSKLEK